MQKSETEVEPTHEMEVGRTREILDVPKHGMEVAAKRGSEVVQRCERAVARNYGVKHGSEVLVLQKRGIDGAHFLVLASGMY